MEDAIDSHNFLTPHMPTKKEIFNPKNKYVSSLDAKFYDFNKNA